MNIAEESGPQVTLHVDVADYLAAMHAAANMGGNHG